MYFKVHFETVIRGHHVYKHTWTPVIDQVLQCEKDNCAEAQEHDSNAVGVYLVTTQSDTKKTLAGHVPIELSHLVKELPRSRSRKQAVCASNRKTKERSWACCAGKVHGPDIRASHSKNPGKRAYRPGREIQSL